jgi:hypothetical protein
MEHALLDSAHLLDSLDNLFAVLIRPPAAGLSLRGVSNSNIGRPKNYPCGVL